MPRGKGTYDTELQDAALGDELLELGPDGGVLDFVEGWHGWEEERMRLNEGEGCEGWNEKREGKKNYTFRSSFFFSIALCSFSVKGTTTIGNLLA